MAAEPNAVTSIADIRKSTAAPEQSLPAVRLGFDNLQSFELMQRVARAFAASSLVPQNYQGNIPDCIIAIELAQRIGASPLMVAQNLYIVHGRPAWSSQFLIAAVNQCGRYTALQYEWSGERGSDNWTCRAHARDKATGERVQGPAVSIAMAKKEGWYDKKGSKWQTIPELMLMYRAATFFARTNAPELTMGISTDAEAHDIYDAEPTPAGTYTVADLKAGGDVIDAPAGDGIAAAPEQPAPAPADTQPGELDFERVLVKIDRAKNAEEAAEILDLCRGQPWAAKAQEAYKARWK